MRSEQAQLKVKSIFQKKMLWPDSGRRYVGVGQARDARGSGEMNMAAMIKKAGVIGSGQMGNGIAHVSALAGLDVVLNDLSDERLKSAMATIYGHLARQVAKQTITEDARKKALARITSA